MECRRRSLPVATGRRRRRPPGPAAGGTGARGAPATALSGVPPPTPPCCHWKEKETPTRPSASTIPAGLAVRASASCGVAVLSVGTPVGGLLMLATGAVAA